MPVTKPDTLSRRKDSLGRVYWYDTAKKKRVKPPKAHERPRAFARDKKGRGYWYFLDTGHRAPKPQWTEVPQTDAIGRPRDSLGRMVPRSAIVAVAPTKPLSRRKPPKPSKRLTKPTPERPVKRRTKKERAERERQQELALPSRPGPRVRVRAKLPPAPPRTVLVRPDEPIPGFDSKKPLYWTNGASSSPRDIGHIFQSWMRGVLRKRPQMSASEIEFGQHGIAFEVEAPIDTVAMAELRDKLAGLPIELAFRPNRGAWQIFMKLLKRDRKTGQYATEGAVSVGSTMSSSPTERAARIIYEYFMDAWDVEPWWYLYMETTDTVYEGGD